MQSKNARLLSNTKVGTILTREDTRGRKFYCFVYEPFDGLALYAIEAVKTKAGCRIVRPIQILPSHLDDEQYRIATPEDGISVATVFREHLSKMTDDLKARIASLEKAQLALATFIEGDSDPHE